MCTQFDNGQVVQHGFVWSIYIIVFFATIQKYKFRWNSMKHTMLFFKKSTVSLSFLFLICAYPHNVYCIYIDLGEKLKITVYSCVANHQMMG